MSKLKDKVWPPKGWMSLRGIKNTSGQALVKDSNSAVIKGLKFKIDSEPLYSGSKALYAHYVHVEGWEYSIQSESIEFPILSFNVVDRFDEVLPEEYYLSNVKVMACPVELSERTARKTLDIFAYFIRQIERGKVPDIDRILHIYRMHPVTSQSVNLRSYRSQMNEELKKVTELGRPHLEN